MPRLLELFAGTGSIGRAFRDRGWEVVSLDIDPKSKPTIVADILEWDYEKAYPKGHFQFVHGSPLCTYYSIARSTKKSTEEELAYSDSLVKKCLEIMKFFGSPWSLENPATGRLKKRPFMIELSLPHRDVSYCRYGTSYKKATRIWNTLGEHWQPKPVCCKDSRCEHFANNVHPATAQRGPCYKKGLLVPEGCHRQNELYHIPAELCDEIAAAAESAVKERDAAQTSEAAGPGHREEQARLQNNFGGDSK
jgi:hypothetical protein